MHFGSDWIPAVTQHVSGFSFRLGSGAELTCILMTVYKLLTVCSGKNPTNKQKTKTEKPTHTKKESGYLGGFQV